MNHLRVLDNLSILFQYFCFNTINILTYGCKVGRIQWNFIKFDKRILTIKFKTTHGEKIIFTF